MLLDQAGFTRLLVCCAAGLLRIDAHAGHVVSHGSDIAALATVKSLVKDHNHSMCSTGKQVG